jgi:hypothetical protein
VTGNLGDLFAEILGRDIRADFLGIVGAHSSGQNGSK